MSDILLLLGAALGALSVLMAIVSVMRTQPPRAAAIALVLGVVLMFAGVWMSERPFGVETLTGAAQRLVDGQIGQGGNTDPAAPVAETAPATETGVAPAAEAAPAQPSQ